MPLAGLKSFPGAHPATPRAAWLGLTTLHLLLWLLLPTLGAAESAGAMKGLPLTRFYSFDDIGDVSRGAQLSFDSEGRLAVVQDGAYLVLNDDVWIEQAVRDPQGAKPQRVRRDDADNTLYYCGSVGTWGRLSVTEQGSLLAEPLMPVDCPPWVASTNFTEIVCRPEGVYFVGRNGAAHWNRHTRLTTFIALPVVVSTFILADKVYVSTHAKGVLTLDVDRGAFEEADPLIFEGRVVDHVAILSPQRAILSTIGRRLLLLDQQRLTPIKGALGERLAGRVSAMQTLDDGNVALAVAGQGLYFITPQGDILTALTHPDYRFISSLATNGGGVLWAATESGVAKVLYGTPVTSFGQALGLPIGWPQIVQWNGETIIASNGRLFHPVNGLPGEPIRFQLMPGQPANGTWGIATWQEWLLAASTDGVFARRPGEAFQHVLPKIDANRLAMLRSGVCLIVGEREIGALRWEDGAWRECAPRVPGIGYPSLIHTSSHAAWIEIGGNRAGRIELDGGQIKARLFDSFPWPDPRWIHVSIVGDTAVLNGPEAGRIFLDEATGEPRESSALAAIFAHAPHWIARLRGEDGGTLWASHAHGVFTLAPGPGGYTLDADSHRVITEHIPFVQTPSIDDTWISTGQSLYHVSRTQRSSLDSVFKPRVVSVRDLRTNRELIRPGLAGSETLKLVYRQNSIALRFFTGNYASRRTPRYEYQLNDPPWTSLDATSLLRLSDLREGAYHLRIRLVDERGPLGEETIFNFRIAPPWYRSWYAYGAYLFLATAVIFGLVRISLYRARARNDGLERMVTQRTEELKATMHKLQQEAQTSATLAERNRLAGEIHDSLEQGFTGLTLQLETTANFSACPAEVKNALAVALSMVAFSRNEVRHAVQNLHSPILDSADLGTALKQIVAHIAPSPSYATITTEGAPRPLSSTIEHHLLRIAQEAITNAVKHASASHLEVVLAFELSAVRLTIRDDGRGFDPGTVLNSNFGHFGLPSFRGRANKIGGTVEISSRPGDGTRIVVQVPIEPEAPRGTHS